jgi:hypothetical protein
MELCAEYGRDRRQARMPLVHLRGGAGPRFSAKVSAAPMGNLLVIRQVMPLPAVVLAGKTGLPLVGLAALLF